MGKKWKWTEEQKAAHSARLRKYWADRRKAKQSFWQQLWEKVKGAF